jgi:hypothetical protein
MSTMLSEYGSSLSGRSSTGRMFETSPRRSTPRAIDFETSCVKRVQRRHRMQRSFVEQDAVRKVVELRRLHFLVAGQRGIAVVRVVVVLQRAFAGLVADAAVHGVVQRDELQDRLAMRLDLVRLREHLHARAHGHVAGNVEAAAFDLDEAHAAVAGDRQLRDASRNTDVMAVRQRHLHDGLVRARPGWLARL